jgi:hypothetical protein
MGPWTIPLLHSVLGRLWTLRLVICRSASDVRRQEQSYSLIVGQAIAPLAARRSDLSRELGLLVEMEMIPLTHRAVRDRQN